MTGPLAAERPTEDEVRTQVTTLLRQLGSTEHMVAGHLLAGGYRGEQGQCETCPVANYVADGLRAAGWSPDAVNMTAAKVMVAFFGVARGENDLHVYVAQPRAVTRFIFRFDLGAYAQLRVVA